MQNNQLPASLEAIFATLPPALTIRQIASIWNVKLETLRQQVRRSVFPLRVQQIEGGQQFVATADLIKFWKDGQPQIQPPILKRTGRNPHGRHGKRGRPSNAELSARRQATELVQQREGI